MSRVPTVGGDVGAWGTVLNDFLSQSLGSDGTLKGVSAINAKDPAYGAKGNGVTDDTTAIQSALNAVPASGGTVFLPAGTYKITAALTVNANNVRFVGMGAQSTVITRTDTGASTTMLSLATTTSITDFYAADFQLSHTNTGGAGNFSAIDSSTTGKTVTRALFERLRIVNTNANPGGSIHILVPGSSDIRILNNYFLNGNVQTDGNDLLLVEGNTFIEGFDATISTGGDATNTGTRAVIRGNILKRSAASQQGGQIEVGKQIGAIIADNYIDGAYASGIHLWDQGTGTCSTDVVISGNVIRNCGTNAVNSGGIYLNGLSAAKRIVNTVIAGNHVSDNNGTGIMLSNNILGATVVANIVKNQGSGGGTNAWNGIIIGTTDVDNVTVADNVASDDQGVATQINGIWVQNGATNIALGPNVATGNTTAQLRIDSLGSIVSLDARFGGLGLNTAAVGDLLYASATTPTWAKLAAVASGQVLRSAGVNTAPAWSPNVNVTGYITGQGVNPGGLGGSRFVLDTLGVGAGMRLFSYGVDAVTNGNFLFNTQRSDGSNSLDVMTAGPGVSIGTPTGGDKGAGTINFASGAYQNGNVFVTSSGAHQSILVTSTLGAGAGATLGTVGGSGPPSAAQKSWMPFLSSTGGQLWIPVWSSS